MRIVRFQDQSGISQVGVLADDDVIYAVDGDLLGKFRPSRPVAPLSEVKLLAPCQPSKIVCIAINFAGIDGFSEEMVEPLVFVKPGSAVTDPGSLVVNPFPKSPWWGEAELGVVIGKQIGPMSRLVASESVLGFTIGNDTTVDNVEGRDHHLARSKCPDRFCALGPWIETELEAGDLLIEATQDGEVIRRGRTSQQFWQWPTIIERVSKWMTLNPWDVVLTGNPPDCGGMKYLGDKAEYSAYVEGIGTLTNDFSCSGPA